MAVIANKSIGQNPKKQSFKLNIKAQDVIFLEVFGKAETMVIYIYFTSERSVRTSVVSGLISRPLGVVGGTPRAQKNRNQKKVPLGYVLI